MTIGLFLDFPCHLYMYCHYSFWIIGCGVPRGRATPQSASGGHRDPDMGAQRTDRGERVREFRRSRDLNAAPRTAAANLSAVPQTAPRREGNRLSGHGWNHSVIKPTEFKARLSSSEGEIHLDATRINKRNGRVP